MTFSQVIDFIPFQWIPYDLRKVIMDVPFSLLLELVGIQYIENKEKELLDLTDSKNEPGVNIANKWLLKSEIFTGAEVKKADQKAKEDKLL